jgi:Flp pilus assembly protein TadD
MSEPNSEAGGPTRAAASPTDAEDAAGLNLRGSLHLMRGEGAEAAACFERALALAPGDAVVLNNLGNALAQQGRLGEAHAAYVSAVGARPE